MLVQMEDLLLNSFNVFKNINFPLKLTTLLKEHLHHASEVNQTRVNFFRHKILSGQYKINCATIAEKLEQSF